MVEIATGWVSLDRASGDLEGQIYRALRERILDGRLSLGQTLPASRAFATALGVARSTVVRAYERLAAEGFTEARAGAATRIAASPSPARREVATASPIALDTRRAGRLRPGLPDLAAFPHALWARMLAARARALRLHDLGYGAVTGLPELRSAILDHVAAARGVMAQPEQVLILPSTAAGLSLLTQLALSDAEDRPPNAWIEEPGYPTAQAVLRHAGVALTPIPCDESGIDVSRAPPERPHLIYVTPSHQYPTGATMSLPRRLALLEAAQAAGALILEDDYDSEFHYEGRPIAALQGIDRGQSVAYLGTFSKVLAPGLRIAYAIVPRRFVSRAAEAMRYRGAVVPIHMQAALADFLNEGHLRAHVRRMRPVYAARMADLATALETHCGAMLEVGLRRGGLQLAAWLRDVAADDRALAARLAEAGFGMQPLSQFHLGPARPGLLFSIADAVPETVRAVAAALNAKRK